MALRVSALIGSICCLSPRAMKEERNGWPSIFPRILTRPFVPKTFADCGVPNGRDSQWPFAAAGLRDHYPSHGLWLIRLRAKVFQGAARDRGRALYEQAIRSAHSNGFVHNEAIAYEIIAARFYAAGGLRKFADAYLLEARPCYQRWGPAPK